MFIISRDWILFFAVNREKNQFPWTRDQLDAINISWPPFEDWMNTIEGKEISFENKERFEKPFRNMKTKKEESYIPWV